MNNMKPCELARETVLTLLPVLAFVAIIVVVILVPELIAWIEAPDTSDGQTLRSTIVRNMGIGLGGALGLFLTYVRSRALDKQANEAIEQGKRADLQIRAAANTVQGQLFRDATEMVQDRTKGKVGAGVALLISIAEDKTSEFHASATLVLSQFLSNQTLDNEPGGYVHQAAACLDGIADQSGLPFNVTGMIVKQEFSRTNFFNNLVGVTYDGVVVREAQITKQSQTTLNNCRISRCRIEKTTKLKGNIQFYISVPEFYLPSLLDDQDNFKLEFYECDLSRVVESLDHSSIPVTIRRCYYLDDGSETIEIADHYKVDVLPKSPDEYWQIRKQSDLVW